MNDRVINTIKERANDMLKDEHIRRKYNSFENIDTAQEWLLNSALYTLITPLNERM